MAFQLLDGGLFVTANRGRVLFLLLYALRPKFAHRGEQIDQTPRAGAPAVRECRARRAPIQQAAGQRPIRLLLVTNETNASRLGCDTATGGLNVPQ